MTTLEQVGSRLYFANSPFASKDAIKRLGGHWDGDRRQWWVGSAKRPAAERLVAEINGTTPATNRTATPASDRAAAAVGLDKGTPADVVADKVEDGGDAKKAAELRKPAEDIDGCRVYAKVEYKGRTYYVIAETKDRTRCRLATLQEDGPVFWADMSQCRLLKTYEGREKWDGRRYSNRTVTVYTTLGSLRSFVADQRAAEKNGVPQCPVCGRRNDNMVRDLETGMTCCRGCADMPE